METKKWLVDKFEGNMNSYPQIQEAAQLLRQGEVIAFPTETVYGLGADAMNSQAVEKIFTAKGRPSDNPLIVHIAKVEQLEDVVTEIPSVAEKLIKAFWPGPLTIILPKKDGLSEKVTAELNSVGVRMPFHPVALALLEVANIPIAAPSANISGRPSPTTAKHVYNDLQGKIAGVVDGGATGVGVESTVLDCTGEIPVILRPGGVTKEQLEEVVGTVEIDVALKSETATPKSPGMKYTHYAPQAPLIIVKGSKEFLQELVAKERREGKKVGVLTTRENEKFYQADVVLPCGKRENLATVAHHLYDVLRHFDEYHLDVIYSENFSEEGIGRAIINRLSKASGHRFVSEKKKILFVCTGNTCRSPMAEAVLKHIGEEKFEVRSAGTFAFSGSELSENAKLALAERGIFTNHRATLLSEELLEWADYVLTMTDDHKRYILNGSPNSREKVFTLYEFVQNEQRDITDPFGQSLEQYRETLQELEGLLTVLKEVELS